MRDRGAKEKADTNQAAETRGADFDLAAHREMTPRGDEEIVCVRESTDTML
jgi:hypothetical protein